MTIVSHVLFPLVFAQSANGYRTQSRLPRFFDWKNLLFIGLAGGLPDILSPHLYLESRYSSLTHSVWFLLTAIILSASFAWRLKKFRALIGFCIFAVSLHLLCDMVSGGINLLAPFGNMIVGRYYVRTRYWIALDVAAILFFSLSCLYGQYRARARAFVLFSGLAICIGGAVLAFLKLDTENFFLKRISASKMNPVQLENAQQAAHTLFTKWQAGTYEPLSTEFTEEMRGTMTPQWQRSFVKQIGGAVGDYEGISFVEMVAPRFGYPRIVLCRFKGSYSRTLQRPEIRFTFDSNGKISGFHWFDRFNDRLMNY
jgi:hypothetical protein